MQVKVRNVDNAVCMIVLCCRGEYVYGGSREGFYVCKCAEVSVYVYSYKDIDLYYGNEVEFCVLCLDACIRYQRTIVFF